MENNASLTYFDQSRMEARRVSLVLHAGLKTMK